MAAFRGQEWDINVLIGIFLASALFEILALFLGWQQLEIAAAGMGILMLVDLIVVLPLSYSRLDRLERLLAYGKPARAVVVGVESFRIRGHFGARRTKWVCTLEFQDDSGSPVRIATPPSLNKKFSANEVLTVVYDLHKPTQITTYPVAGYEVGGSGTGQGIPGDRRLML